MVEKEKSKKELLEEQIDEDIKKNKEQVVYLEKYKKVLNIPTKEFISKYIATGEKFFHVDEDYAVDVKIELLIRLLLKENE
jgi:hypothetical protein